MSLEKFKPKLEILKQKLQTGKDFNEIVDYFYTHFGENLQFMNLGTGIDHELLRTVVAEVMQNVVKPTKTVAIVMQSRFIDVDGNFIHGPVNFGDYLLSVLYFRDIDMGLVAVTQPGKSPMCLYCRFSVMPLKGKKSTPYLPPKGKSPN